jgi:hypothetical protein
MLGQDRDLSRGGKTADDPPAASWNVPGSTAQAPASAFQCSKARDRTLIVTVTSSFAFASTAAKPTSHFRGRSMLLSGRLA